MNVHIATKPEPYPVRYSLKPHECRELVEIGRNHAGLTLAEIRGLARSRKVAAKVVHNTILRAGVPIISEDQRARLKPPKKAKPRPTLKSVFAPFENLPLEVSENPKLETVEENRPDPLGSVDLRREVIRQREVILDLRCDNEELAVEVELLKERIAQLESLSV